ncbi:hypothetical protein A8B79_04315 [Balneola sp. EhC07]|uniref:hypothetical protein n=1 Tax=Balneola sp. EhC07 TaxID=1849360 RepID=UPI0007F4E4ED|nr:hypothetical protein [Balneola sp. EhC07]OAN61657.1 hypothetical protein A8B79_04315 [Balneola sp. EhC07]
MTRQREPVGDALKPLQKNIGEVMAGMRKLTDKEYELIEACFVKKRNLTMVSIQRWAGYRIRDVLSWKD